MVAGESGNRAVVGEPRVEPAATGSTPSRRALLSGGAAAATAAILSACSGGSPLREKVRAGGKVAKADVEPLNTLLAVEHYAVAAYAAGFPLLPLHSPQYKAAQQFLAQELSHTVQLSDLIRSVKGKPDRPAARYDLGSPRSTADAMALFKRLEQVQIHTYLDTIPRLSGGGSRAAAVSIMSNDAQHLTVLRWQTGVPPVPSALVSGG